MESKRLLKLARTLFFPCQLWSLCNFTNRTRLWLQVCAVIGRNGRVCLALLPHSTQQATFCIGKGLLLLESTFLFLRMHLTERDFGWIRRTQRLRRTK